ncbi:MAG: hypothetical protein U0905_18370 [Pirellulales bacterium]
MGPRNDQGLLPKERYCGDISTPVHSLSVEGKGWRALHDWVPILRTLDQPTLADRVQKYETNLRPQLKIISKPVFIVAPILPSFRSLFAIAKNRIHLLPRLALKLLNLQQFCYRQSFI